ncbi:MAG TPA: SRPBCC family protein [Acidisarcina sp.]
MVEAPVGVVWSLLTDPQNWGEFFDVRIVDVTPAGRAVVGQLVRATAGPRVLRGRITFRFLDIDAVSHRLLIEVEFPLGIQVMEDMTCMPLDAAHCRVNYGCHFSFRAGWRGAVTKYLLRRELRDGPIDSLSRLKRMAERVYSNEQARQQKP